MNHIEPLDIREGNTLGVGELEIDTAIKLNEVITAYNAHHNEEKCVRCPDNSSQEEVRRDFAMATAMDVVEKREATSHPNRLTLMSKEPVSYEDDDRVIVRFIVEEKNRTSTYFGFYTKEKFQRALKDLE